MMDCEEMDTTENTANTSPMEQDPGLMQEETCSRKRTNLEIILEDLGLQPYFKDKLPLSKILEINKKAISDDPVMCKSDIPWYFLKKLTMVNVTARKVKCTSVSESKQNNAPETTELDFDDLFNDLKIGDSMNPLDLITALFLCSDGFVQQEMALKMSMCQFSVPLLLPNCDTTQCTLMLWAMRDIVKKYRPQHLLESKGFIEERIVHSQFPMVSFVRLGDCSLSKSEILNKLLSGSQQYHDTFVHRNMECGDSPRQISNGLTEISWYLPCGNKNMDIFVEPVAIANLRGDIASFETQFSFLSQTSEAVFVFFDLLDDKCELLMNKNHKAKLFFVGSPLSKNEKSLKALKTIATSLHLTKSNIIMRTKERNDADFVEDLKKTVSDVVEKSRMKMSVEQMVGVAHELGILVDEDSPECQAGKEKADAITEKIKDIYKYKEKQLPLQGEIWKKLTYLEKEEFRLRNAGSENVEQYKSDLQNLKKELRKKQNSYDMSPAMTCFIHAISSPGTERCYFLKWMRMNLDNVSRTKLSGLRELYKEKCNSSVNMDEIKEIDIKLSNSSLGTEHYFREMGQLYEASVSLPDKNLSRKQLQHLPELCAQLLLDGFPLELVDGDASNIPLRWVSDVLSKLNDLAAPKNKIMVVTVLGVQSTGKSTLLNTMFGVQFAVSSGRCTRGAFMLLIKVDEDVKKVFNCDFMVILDTEGLKSPELSQLDNSYEHDNELATLVVGLSDITIINIAMENSTEMKDILQIVVHAFLRMKEVGKKPKCQFVHQNVSDVSAHEKNLRDRKLLLQQLNEMTQAAARMEKKEKNKSFTDVMVYNPDTGNCYVPGLWNGNPPMAPVNAGYSEAAYELKKNIIHLLGKNEPSAQTILDFKKWMTSLWNAVKHENFIFSFRNSLVAEAYVRLCTEFNKWEREFRKEMFTWVTKAETRISNFGINADSDKPNITGFLSTLKTEALTVLSKWETNLLGNLKEYFKQTEGHVYLVEGYKEEFSNGIKSLRREMERSVINQLTAAADIRLGMNELDKIKENQTKEIEKSVSELIAKCQKKNVKMTDAEVDKEFDKMWTEILKKLSFSQQKPKDVYDNVIFSLRCNLSPKGSRACELLSERNLRTCGSGPFKYSADGWFKKCKHTLNKWFNIEDHLMAVENLSDSIIKACRMFVAEKVQQNSNYHETYIRDILHFIDERLKKNNEVTTDIDFEVSLKQYICGFAARDFQRMHEDFIHAKDPYRCLMKDKEKFRADFKDVFYKRDQCQKKAEEFTEKYLKPAVEAYVNHYLGNDITDEMLTKEEFSTRMSFQYAVLLDLLSQDDFSTYVFYICSYEDYVKTWILCQISRHFPDAESKFELEDGRLKTCISNINNAINEAKRKKSDNLQMFVKDMCKELHDKLSISQDAHGAFMILNQADQEQFAHWLTQSVKDMADSLREKFKTTTFQMIQENLQVKPQNEIFKRLIGCGKQCPFCGAPCEAGGNAHNEHFASLHRQTGLGRTRWDESDKLVTDICTSCVSSDVSFRRNETNNQWHPYKRYREIFPDWDIRPDGTLQASDYWKYVMTKYNKSFADEFTAKPADIPSSWNDITIKQAEASLKESFNKT